MHTVRKNTGKTKMSMNFHWKDVANLISLKFQLYVTFTPPHQWIIIQILFSHNFFLSVCCQQCTLYWQSGRLPWICGFEIFSPPDTRWGGGGHWVFSVTNQPSIENVNLKLMYEYLCFTQESGVTKAMLLGCFFCIFPLQSCTWGHWNQFAHTLINLHTL